MENNIIFLDFNGVLNSECYFIKRDRNMKDLKLIDLRDFNDDFNTLMYLYYIDPIALERVIKIVNITNSKVVVTSSWKTIPCFEKIKEYLVHLGLPIIDETKEEICNRGNGIKEYLSDNKIENYIIIDDVIFDDYDDEMLSHLVKTDLIDGITEEDVDLSINLLNSKKLIKDK